MKIQVEQMIEEISNYLINYLKSGHIGINSFIQKTDLNLANLEQLLEIHFLLQNDLKKFVYDLPTLIRRFKTSTTVTKQSYHGEIRGQINWPETLKNRLQGNPSDKTVFSVNERDREYSIKENLVLLELLEVLYELLFKKLPTDRYVKYTWFSEWLDLKKTVRNVLQQNIYLSRVKQKRQAVTERMIIDTMKHRNPLYRESARMLMLYRQIMNGELDDDTFKSLLQETFVFPDQEDVLFELYCITQLIEQNAINAEFYLLEGTQNMVAKWHDDEYIYQVYHDSIGSGILQYHVSVDEVIQHQHPFITREIDVVEETQKLSKEWFNRSIDTTTYWSGRPDVMVEIFDRQTGQFQKVIIGEVKFTSNENYMIEGLKELNQYIKHVRFRDQQDSYGLGGRVEGVLFGSGRDNGYKNNDLKIYGNRMGQSHKLINF